MHVGISSKKWPAWLRGDDFADRRVIVMGLGRFGGGVGVTRWLATRGADVLVTDTAAADRLTESVVSLADLQVRYQLGRHDEVNLNDTDLLVVSPAVDKRRSAFFQAAVRRGIPWTTEINLFVSRCPARIVGVTGTAGKSTTAAMIHAILRSAANESRCFLGGNIGKSLLPELNDMSERDNIVLELSSFQLEDACNVEPFVHIGVFLNCKPNHLDRHPTFEQYLDCKLNLIRRVIPGSTCVFDSPDRVVAEAVRRAAESAGVYLITPEVARDIDLRLPGEHNQQNARFALAATRSLGVDNNKAIAALKSFDGLPHRLQHVGVHDGVIYYNDSKATTLAGTVTAIRSMTRPTILLFGGKDSGGEFKSICEIISEYTRSIICFGAVGPRLFASLREQAPASVVVHHSENVASATHLARKQAQPGDVVLFSPGFQSYDAFENYEQRGQFFLSLIRRDGV